MTRPDEHETVDLQAVAADDHLVEHLRRLLSPDAAVVWDDDDDLLDPAVSLLRALQLEVGANPARDRNLPLEASHAVAGGVVTPLRGRHLRRGTAVAAVAAAVLSVGGVAAAAIAPGHPLGVVGSGVSSALSRVLDAITPPSRHQARVSPVSSAPSTEARSVGPAPLASAAAGRSTDAAQVQAFLDRAATFLADGQYAAAREQLDAAAARLSELSGVSHDTLAARLAVLRAELAHRRKGHHSSTPGGASTQGSGPSSTSARERDAQGGPGSTPKRSRDRGGSPSTTGDPRVSPGSGSRSSGTSGRGPRDSTTRTATPASVSRSSGQTDVVIGRPGSGAGPADAPKGTADRAGG